MTSEYVNNIKDKIKEAENVFDVLSNMVMCLQKIGDEYQENMSDIYSRYGKASLSFEESLEDKEKINSTMYGTIQSKMYLEYNDIITKERVIREDKVKELEQNKKIDLKTISDARIERIKIINDYIVGYDRSRDVIENLKPSVYIDFIKNKKKVISSLETLKKEIPSKPDMKNVVMELVSEEKRIKKLIEEYYLGKVETVNKEYENKYNEIKKTYVTKIKDVEEKREEFREEQVNKTRELIKMVLMDEELLQKFNKYMLQRILFDGYSGEIKNLPEYYDIGVVGLKIPDIFFEDEFLRKSFKEYSNAWVKDKIITPENVIKVPLLIPRKTGYSIVLPCLEINEVTSFVLRNSMMFPVGKMEYVAICTKTTRIFSPLHSIQKQGIILSGIGTNYDKESEIENKIEDIRKTVKSYNDRFFEKSDMREKKEHFRTVMIYDYENGINEKSKKYLSDMIDSAPENGINFVFFCDNPDDVDNSVFGSKTFIIKKNSSLYNKNKLSLRYKENEFIYDIGEVANKDVWESVIRKMIPHIGERVDDIFTVEDLLPDIKDANSYFNGGDTTDGIVVPIAFLGTEPFDFVIGKSAGDDTRHFTLIKGVTGSGKTELLHAIMISIMYKYLPTEVQFCMMDYKEGVGANHFTGSPYLRSIVKQGDRVAGRKELAAIVEEMNRRYRMFESEIGEDGRKIDKIYAYRKKTGKTVSKIIVVIDELCGLTDRGDEIAKDCLESIKILAKQGRAAGIHMIITDQTFTDSGLSEGTMDMFVHRFSCIGKGKTIYKEYNKEKKEAGEMILERTLDTVFVNDYIDGIVSRINKLLPAYIETENLISTQIISSAASDHIKNPLNSFDTCDICKEAIHLYVGYAEDNEDSELVLNGSLLVVSNEKISETGRPGGISILTYVLLSIIQNRFANGEIVDNIISMVAIEAEDKYIKQIDRVRKVFPQYIQGVYACTGDDDDMYELHVDEVKRTIDNVYKEYEMRCNEDDNDNLAPRCLIIYGLHKLIPLKVSKKYDMNTGFIEKDSISKIKELICNGAKKNIYVIAWLDEHYEDAAKLFEIENIQEIFSIVMASGMGEKMKALVNYSGENANFDDYAIFKRKKHTFSYKEIKLFETPTDEWLDEFYSKCVDKFKIEA